MHVNKALYTFSYTCVTAGAAGILFIAIYVMVINDISNDAFWYELIKEYTI